MKLKRIFLVTFLVSTLIIACRTTTTKIQPTLPIFSPAPEMQQGTCLLDNSLRAFACQRNFYLGSAMNGYYLPDEPEYYQVLTREFNMLTTGYVMKFAPIHPEPDVYDFSYSDPLVDFAEQNSMLIRGHTLLWHAENPAWIKNGNWTPEQLTEIMREHIHTVVGRYKNRIPFWDVINEGISDKNFQLRSNKWMDVIGASYIDLAFQFAHEADPNALLFYNDYGGEGLGEKSDAIYALLKDLRSRNIPIHGVGLQMHVTLDTYPSQSDLHANIRRLADLGLIVHITEMDVAIPEPVTAEKLQQQADIYRNILEVCLSEPACQALVVWGFTDKHSWIPDHFKGYNAACLFDSSYLPKPAYFAVQQTLEK